MSSTLLQLLDALQEVAMASNLSLLMQVSTQITALDKVVDTELEHLSEAKLHQRLRRHGWGLVRRPVVESASAASYKIIDIEDGSTVIGEDYTLDLQDVAIWLE